MKLPPWPQLLIVILALLILGLLVSMAPNPVWAGMNALFVAAALIYLTAQTEQERAHARELDQLKTAYDALDEQAKLIIKTDLELNRTHAELDKKIGGLISLHSWSQRTRTITNTDELLAQFDESLVIPLGYDRGLLLLYRRHAGTAHWSRTVGYAADATTPLLAFLDQSSEWRQLVEEQRPLLLNQPDARPGFEQAILKRCQLTSLIAVPLPLKDESLLGMVVMGHEGLYAHVTSGDQDLLSILASQLATDMENVRLYEQAWGAQRALELKVQERTRDLATANEELQRLNRAKSDFVNAVAHELRTPLTSIKGYASILKSGQLGEVSPAQGDRLAKMNKHSDDLTQLINNLLDISRIESGKTTMECTHIPVEHFLKDLDDLVRPLVEPRHVRLELDGGQVGLLWADPQQIKRVFMNLLSNAIKYTPEGGTIRVAFVLDDAHIHARVSDTGAGIGPDDLAHLFEEFYRARTAMNAQIRGTGLGLTLVKKIVEAHGGKIWVESVVGQGSTFHVLLPQAPPAHQERPHV